MYGTFETHLHHTLEDIRRASLYKNERLIVSPQNGRIRLADGREVINMCGNNYLGFADHPAILEAAHEALDRCGFGMGSVRFICGTQEAHRELELELSRFLHTDDAILYSSCFDANGGLFETLLSSEDAIISDALNHASIIDGVRLCKAQRYRYANADMDDLEKQLQAAADARFKLIATDGVFSMDGTIAPLDKICDLADKYGALVMVDDSHAVGFLGARGIGSIEYRNVLGRVDIVTGTFGKALGGAGGGYTAGRKEIIELLRQRSRPYLFSNALSPSVVAASRKALTLVQANPELRKKLFDNAERFRAGMEALGYELGGADHPIVPVMLHDAGRAMRMAEDLLKHGVYAIGFAYPVVPMGAARIRTQLSAAHSSEDVDAALKAFAACKNFG